MRHVGMYRRAELIRRGRMLSDSELRVLGRRVAEIACADGRHAAETDAETGNEVCRRCGVVVDNYADVAELT